MADEKKDRLQAQKKHHKGIWRNVELWMDIK